MRYYDADTIKVFEHSLYSLFGMKIEMIGRFIHDDHVRSCEKHLSKSYFCSFSSGKSLDSLMPFFVLHKESTEHSTDLLISIMSSCEIIHDSRFWIESREYL